ncbi:hypothetical protein SLS55_010193 [Diplodia seriata]|uniref:PNPLA domain-containing protein n=1 Tax=Diplodia seriata TaxID=420778 RepID=A0ABR3C0D7_9PEZI
MVALGLGVKAWSVEKCIQTFEGLVKDAFTPRTGIRFLRPLVIGFKASKYETKPLEGALAKAFGTDEYLFGGRRPSAQYESTKKVIVMTTSSGMPVALSNYGRHVPPEKLTYHYQRGETEEKELKIWEAARATSAAPFFFKPFEHKGTGQTYLDGALFHNNPICIALRERQLLWPDEPCELPDLILSLGTGMAPERKVQEQCIPPERAHQWLPGFLGCMLQTAKDHFAMALNCENIWKNFVESQSRSWDLSRFHRFNPVLVGDVPSLDAVDQMKSIQAQHGQNL